MTAISRKGHPHQTPENKLMQMQRIGLVNRHTTLETPSPDREHGFKYGIKQDGQRIKRRNTRVTNHQLHGQLGQHEAQKIGPAVAQEYPPKRKIPHAEA